MGELAALEPPRWYLPQRCVDWAPYGRGTVVAVATGGCEFLKAAGAVAGAVGGGWRLVARRLSSVG